MLEGLPCAGEDLREALHRLGDERVGSLDRTLGLVDEAGLDVAPAAPELRCFLLFEEHDVGERSVSGCAADWRASRRAGAGLALLDGFVPQVFGAIGPPRPIRVGAVHTLGFCAVDDGVRRARRFVFGAARQISGTRPVLLTSAHRRVLACSCSRSIRSASWALRSSRSSNSWR